MPSVGQFKKAALKWLDGWFSDPELVTTITYELYQGRDQSGVSINSFPLTAIMAKNITETEEIEGVFHQVGERSYILRTRNSDLPAGVTVDMLTQNGRVTDSLGTFMVKKIDRSLRFVTLIELGGDR